MRVLTPRTAVIRLFRYSLSFAFACLFLCACVTSGEKFDVEAARQMNIRNNVTTVVEVVRKLGPPKERVVNADGSTYMRYLYRKDSVNPIAQLIPGAFLFVPYDLQNMDVLEILEKDGIVLRYNIFSGKPIR